MGDTSVKMAPIVLHVTLSPQSRTRPLTADVLLSSVLVFFRDFPSCISLKKPAGRPLDIGAAGALPGGGGGGGGGAPVAGIGGGGGGAAPVGGMGGGGGGADGASEPGIGGAGGGEIVALLSGIGGGGGGAAGASEPGAGGGGDAIGVSFAGAGLVGVESRPAADSGRGGAMVPNRMDAS
jgi:hypothetical protein